MPGRVYARMAMPTVGHATGAARGSRAQGGCTWARAVCAASGGCCGAAVRYGAPGCIRPCNEGFLGEYIEARAWGLAPGPRRKFTDDLSVTLSLTGSTRGWEHAWLLGRFRQQVMGPGEPLRTPYGLSVSPWEWWELRLAATGDPGCTNEGAKAPLDDIPALVQATAAPASTPVWADGAAAAAGCPGNMVSAHH